MTDPLPVLMPRFSFTWRASVTGATHIYNLENRITQTMKYMLVKEKNIFCFQ